MTPKWFYGVSTDKEKFLGYIQDSYTYEKLIAIHPVELKEIAEEAIFTARKLHIKLPDYFKGMSENPISFSQDAVDQGLEPDYSEITKINQEQGTDFKNMLEYLENARKYTGTLDEETPNDPLAALASDQSDDIDDVDAYVAGIVSEDID